MSRAPYPHFDGTQNCAARGVNPTDFDAGDQGRGGARGQRAKAICENGCPFLDDCLAYALTHPDERGIWGGTTWPERKQIRRSWLTGGCAA